MTARFRRLLAVGAVAVAGFTLTGCASECNDCGYFGPPPGYTGEPNTPPLLPCGMEIEFQGHGYRGTWEEKVRHGAEVGRAVDVPCANPVPADHPAITGGAKTRPGSDPAPAPFAVYGIAGAGPDQAVVSASPDGQGYWIWVVDGPGPSYSIQGRNGVIDRVEFLN